jgi:hypothetical protein
MTDYNILNPVSVLLVDHAAQNVLETARRPSPGILKGCGDTFSLLSCQLSLNLNAFGKQVEQAAATVTGVRALFNKTFIEQLAQYSGQALLSYLQDIKKLADSDARISPNKINDPVMGVTKTIRGKNGVRFGGKIPIGKE